MCSHPDIAQIMLFKLALNTNQSINYTNIPKTGVKSGTI